MKRIGPFFLSSLLLLLLLFAHVRGVLVTKFFTWFDIILRARGLTAGRNTLSKKFSRPVCIGSRRPEIK